MAAAASLSKATAASSSPVATPGVAASSTCFGPAVSASAAWASAVSATAMSNSRGRGGGRQREAGGAAPPPAGAELRTGQHEGTDQPAADAEGAVRPARTKPRCRRSAARAGWCCASSSIATPTAHPATGAVTLCTVSGWWKCGGCKQTLNRSHSALQGSIATKTRQTAPVLRRQCSDELANELVLTRKRVVGVRIDGRHPE